MERWSDLLGRIDRRILYVGLVVITLLPLVFHWSLPLYPSPHAIRFYQTVESLPTDRLVVVSTDWGPSTLAENRPQSVATFRHLVRRGIKFAIADIGTPNGARLGEQAAEEAIQAEGKQDEFKYGTHFVNFGYKVGEDPWVNAFSRDIPGAIGASDYQNRPLASMPVMNGVQSFGKDVSALVVITASNSIDPYLGFVGPKGSKILMGSTAVMAPTYYGYLDSGQMSGLLTGMKGATEYEQLLKYKGLGSDLIAGQSFAHVYLIFLIVLGNLAVLLQRLAVRRAH